MAAQDEERVNLLGPYESRSHQGPEDVDDDDDEEQESGDDSDNTAWTSDVSFYAPDRDNLPEIDLDDYPFDLSNIRRPGDRDEEAEEEEEDSGDEAEAQAKRNIYEWAKKVEQKNSDDGEDEEDDEEDDDE